MIDQGNIIEGKETFNEVLEFTKKQKLVEEDYSYENLINNPILKPIAETDRTVMDLMEMSYKKFLDAKKNKDEINATIQDIPAYQTSTMMGKIIRLNAEYNDIVKLQNLQIKNLRDCIKEVYKIVQEKYGVYREEKKEPKKIDYKEYLINLSSHEEAKKYAIQILSEFENEKSTPNEKKRFEIACGNIYMMEEDKNNKTIIAKIMKMGY